MQKESNNKILCALFAVFIVAQITAPAFAAEYSFNESQITPTWASISISDRTILADINQNGKVDAIYKHTAASTSLTKAWGSVGTTPITVAGSLTTFDTYTNKILMMSSGFGSPATYKLYHYNLETGAQAVYNTSRCPSGTSAGYGGMIDKFGGTFFNYECSGGGSPYITQSTTTFALNSTANIGAASLRAAFGVFDAQAGVYSFSENRLYNQKTQGADDSLPNGYAKNVGSNRTSNMLGYEYPTASLVISNTVKIYFDGFNMTNNGLYTNYAIKDYRIAPDLSDPASIVLNLPPYILKSTFTNPVWLFFMEDGSTTYLGIADSSTIYYTNYATLLSQLDINHRGVTEYIIDYTQVYHSYYLLNATYPTGSITIINPDSTSATPNSPIRFVLPSGYVLQSPALNRYYYPEYTNTLTTVPIYTTAGTHANILINVENAPASAAMKIVDLTNYNNTSPWVHTVNFLEADDSLTVGLVQSRCMLAYVTDSSLQYPVWINLGSICTNGATTKTLTYSQNLAFTFWSLPWGVTTVYDQDTQNVQSVVRHDNSPFSYRVIITDVNGTEQVNTLYSNVNDTISVQSFNTTGITKPARITVLDDNNSTLYFATMGYPSSLSSVSSFFAQYFTINGFNLLAMLPIVFGAMFTRNTVGIGTMMTIFLIATLGWLGIIAIPEVILYLMIFIGIVGMIAYKVLY